MKPRLLYAIAIVAFGCAVSRPARADVSYCWEYAEGTWGEYYYVGPYDRVEVLSRGV